MSDTVKNIEKVKCQINGQDVEVSKGTSIIEAYTKIKQDIAHYCWHPDLSVAGVCRLCVVEIKGNPKLQIACNTVVQEGMVISNKSEQVEEAVRWGLDFHLINHPLDCPICDQAGECGLQEQYMKYGTYDSSMSEHKVQKRKVVDLGPKIVLDAERCIMCSRCVRFTNEISKTDELGIFNRGDRAEIGTVNDRPLDNSYSMNTVDICPVGALTSKDFRFQQRVWYLDNTETTCPGCSTGCSVKVYHSKEDVFRLKPDTSVQPWMCDEGRDVYKHTRVEGRLLSCKRLNSESKFKSVSLKEAIYASNELIKESKKISLFMTAQNTNEEYEAFAKHFEGLPVHLWEDGDKSKNDQFDDILMRGDKSPNRKGFEKIFTKTVKINELTEGDLVVVVLPENQSRVSNFNGLMAEVQKFKNVIILTVENFDSEELGAKKAIILPMKSFVEKFGTYTNYNNEEKRVQKAISLVTDAVSMTDFVDLLSGKELNILNEYIQNTKIKRELEKNKTQNEFLDKAGV